MASLLGEHDRETLNPGCTCQPCRLLGPLRLAVQQWVAPQRMLKLSEVCFLSTQAATDPEDDTQVTRGQ